MQSAPLYKLLGFRLHEDCVEADGKFYFFFRFFPPNTDIMTLDEVTAEIHNMSALFDGFEQAFSLFATDKVEDLSKVRHYYSNLDPRFDTYVSDIIAQLDSVENNSASVQRAFYFIFTSSNRENNEFYNKLVGRGYHIAPAQKEELVTLFRNFFLREFANTPIHTLEAELLKDKKLAKQLKKHPELLGRELEHRLLPHRIDFHVREAICGDTLRRTLMIGNLPNEIVPQAFMQAATLRGTSFMLRLTPMMSGEVKRMVDTQLNNGKLKLGRTKVTEKIEAMNEGQTLTEFYKSISTSRTQVYYTSCYLELYGSTEKELSLLQEQIMSKLPAGVSLVPLRREQKDAFLSVSPLGTDRFISEANNLPSMSAAALYPFSYSSRIDEHGSMLGTTQRGGPFILDMLQRTSDITNSNFGIIGAAGQGKSTLMKKLIEFLTFQGVSCFTLDPENEYGDLFRKLGGTIYKCVDGRAIINPLEVRWLYREDEDSTDDDPLSKELVNKSMFFQHLSWLKDFFRILFPGISDLDVQALMVLTQEMYATNNIDINSDFSNFTPTDYPTFSDLYRYTEQYDCSTSRVIAPDVIGRLLLRLKECYDGPLSLIFNGHTSVKNADMICFEAAELMEGSKDRTQAVLFNICTWIWTQVMKRDRRIAFNLDELYLFLENMTMIKYINSFSKRSRKYEAMIGISTQQLADCLRPDIATYTTALFNNASFKFLFHPGSLDMDLVRDKLKLTQGETNRIAYPNRGYCLAKIGINRYYVHIDMLPYEQELFGTGGGR